MNPASKNKLLVGLVIVLLIANAITLAMFWVGKSKPAPTPKGGPKDFLVKELQFDTKQKEQLEVLVKDHREAADQLREKTKQAKEQFFHLLQETNVTDSLKQSAATSVSEFTEELDILTLNHFQKIRALCTPSQQQKFDKIINEVVRMMGQPRPPMGPGGDHKGPPPGEYNGQRPPPPEG